MYKTGVIRRVDELGRIVIPKEIRRTMRIKDDDPLEIFVDNNRLIFQKYSLINNLNNSYKDFAKGISKMIGCCVMILDCDKVLYVFGNEDDFYQKNISKYMEKLIKERKEKVINRYGDMQQIIEFQEKEIDNFAVVPITSFGNCYGLIVAYNKDNNQDFNEGDLKLIRFFASIMGKEI